MTSLDLILYRVCGRRRRPGIAARLAYTVLRMALRVINAVERVARAVSVRLSQASINVENRLSEIEVGLIIDRILAEECGAVVPRFASESKIVEMLEAMGFRSIVLEDDEDIVDFVMVKGWKCVRFTTEAIVWGNCMMVA